MHGADVIRDEVVLRLNDKRLAAFSVYIPMILGDSKQPAVEASKEMLKHGIKCYWDGKRELGKEYAKVLNNPYGRTVAWDIYFVYPPGAVWGDAPPKPAYWMHQLAEDELCLDGPKFRGAVEKELKKMAPLAAISFLAFDGCPTTPKMRKNFDDALKLIKFTGGYSLVDLTKLPDTDVRRGYGSPTVLVRGKDLFGMASPADGGGLTCRLYAGGVPSAKQLAAKLKSALAKK